MVRSRFTSGGVISVSDLGISVLLPIPTGAGAHSLGFTLRCGELFNLPGGLPGVDLVLWKWR